MNLHFVISNTYKRICLYAWVSSYMCYMGEKSSKASIHKLPKLFNLSGFLVKRSHATYHVRKFRCDSEICSCHLCSSEGRSTAFVEWV